MMTNACFSSWAGTEFMHCDAPRDRKEVWAAFRASLGNNAALGRRSQDRSG